MKDRLRRQLRPGIPSRQRVSARRNSASVSRLRASADLREGAPGASVVGVELGRSWGGRKRNPGPKIDGEDVDVDLFGVRFKGHVVITVQNSET